MRRQRSRQGQCPPAEIRALALVVRVPVLDSAVVVLLGAVVLLGVAVVAVLRPARN